jgi:hypothetical protein
MPPTSRRAHPGSQMLAAKISNVKASAPSRDSKVVATLNRSDELAATGEVKDGFVKVDAANFGWVQRTLVCRSAVERHEGARHRRRLRHRPGGGAALAREGWTLALLGRREAPLRETLPDARPAGRRERRGPGRRRLRRPAQRFGRLDLLFNNAGISAIGVPIDELSVAQWRGGRHQPHRQLPVRAGGGLMKRSRRGAAASSTTAPSRRMRRGPSRRPTRPPSMRSPGSPS